MKNIAYAGALVALLDVDMEIVEQLLDEKFAAQEGAARIESHARCAWATITPREHFDCPLPFHLEKMDANGDKILIDGNTATALGCVYAGATVAAWYPITPSTSVMDAFKGFCEKYRKDPETGKNNYIIIQAEDELAAIGMVIGASWNGARAFTSTAGPGISLMNELLGLAYYAEIPAVIIDVQRVGPSTGMPTRTQQGDLLECAYASHGDTKHILLFPSNPAECFEFAAKALRSGRALPDAGLPAVRSRHRHERLGGAAPHMGRCLSARSRPRPEPGRTRKTAQIPALHRRRRKSRRAAHAARRASQRRVLHARLRPQQIRRLHRNSGRISGSDGPPAEKAQGRGEVRSGARSSNAVPAPRFGVITIGGCDPAVREGAGCLGRARHRRRTSCASAASRSMQPWKRSSPSTSSVSSSNRIATRSSDRC